MALTDLKKDLKKAGNKKQAAVLSRFFKTGKGEYGEGDVFLGIKVPVQRSIAKQYPDLPLRDIAKLLKSKVHEERLTALFILVHQFKRADEKKRKQIYNLYLQNAKQVNNWDLVDLSAPNIVGEYLLDKPRKILYKLARSKNLWERRIAMLATFTFIRNNDYADTLKLAELLLYDEHDLMHKSVGWMLREVGKRNQRLLEEFLGRHYQIMPRTMLRYAIEKFPEHKRQQYLKK